jgi:hypothetical protein
MIQGLIKRSICGICEQRSIALKCIALWIDSSSTPRTPHKPNSHTKKQVFHFHFSICKPRKEEEEEEEEEEKVKKVKHLSDTSLHFLHYSMYKRRDSTHLPTHR